MNAGVRKMRLVVAINPKNQSIFETIKFINIIFISYKIIFFREKNKSTKNIELSMALLDSGNNRIVQDGSSVLSGDQVLIDIKTNKKG